MPRQKRPRLTPVRSKYQAGMTGTVKGNPCRLCIRNDVGGTEMLALKTYRVRLLKVNPGQRLVGRLLDAKDIAQARKAGTTGYKPDDYLKYKDTNPDLYTSAVQAAKTFDPSIVYFQGFMFIADP